MDSVPPSDALRMIHDEAGGKLIPTQQRIQQLRLFLNVDTPPPTTTNILQHRKVVATIRKPAAPPKQRSVK